MRHSNTTIKLLIIGINLLFWPNLAVAESKGKSNGGSGFYFDETFLPKWVDKNDTGSFTASPGAASETGLGFDTKTTLGYVFGNSLFLGATYNQYSLATKRANKVGGDEGLKESTVNTQLGPTIGWVSPSWRFLFMAILSGEKTVKTKNFDAAGPTGDVTLKNTEASGYQFMLGYVFPVSSSFSVGPTFTYRELNFAKQSKVNALTPAENYNNLSLFNGNHESSMDIMISLILHF